jgi:Winged helix-turn-helix DNA-binding
MTATATATKQVEQLIEHRLQEIEEQLRPFAELEEERRRLRDALGVLRGGGTAGVEVAGAAPQASPARQRHSRRASRGRRAPRGSNLSAILEYVAGNPGATAGEIATATGISRGVVYSATSRLSSSGKLTRKQKPDGQVGYHPAG